MTAGSFIPTGTGKKLASDVETIDIGGNSHTVEKQHVVTVDGNPSTLGYETAELLDAFLATDAPSSDMMVDGSVTAVLFDYVVPADNGALIDELVLWLRDAAASFTATTFASLAALANGLKIEIYDNASTPLLKGTILAAAKDLGDILRAGALLDNAGDLVADCLRFRIRLTRGGRPLYLPAGWRIRATVADNLTAIEELRVAVVGRVIAE